MVQGRCRGGARFSQVQRVPEPVGYSGPGSVCPLPTWLPQVFEFQIPGSRGAVGFQVITYLPWASVSAPCHVSTLPSVSSLMGRRAAFCVSKNPCLPAGDERRGWGVSRFAVTGTPLLPVIQRRFRFSVWRVGGEARLPGRCAGSLKGTEGCPTSAGLLASWCSSG